MYIGLSEPYVTIDRMGRRFTHHKHMLRCDECGLEYDTGDRKAPKRKFHTCSPECKSNANKPGGSIWKQTSTTNIKLYGAANVFASPIIKQRISDTVLERFGAPVMTQTEHFKEKSKATCLEKFGVEYAAQSPIVQAKLVETRIERFGVPYMMQLPRVKEAMRAGVVSKYGVNSVMLVPEIYAKAKATMLERYGAPVTFSVPELMAKAAATMLERYGKAYYATAGKSRAEDSFYEVLCIQFGVADIRRQVLVKPNSDRSKYWLIDFYVASIDAYVQFDGEYWHGLDRPIEVISEFKYVRDVSILGAWERDKRQDIWFAENGLKLVRVTDREFAESDWNDIAARIAA